MAGVKLYLPDLFNAFAGRRRHKRDLFTDNRAADHTLDPGDPCTGIGGKKRGLSRSFTIQIHSLIIFEIIIDHYLFGSQNMAFDEQRQISLKLIRKKVVANAKGDNGLVHHSSIPKGLVQSKSFFQIPHIFLRLIFHYIMRARNFIECAHQCVKVL